MKFLVVLLVVAVGLWMLLARSRGDRPRAPRAGKAPPASSQAMVACAHCGLHLPVSEASMRGDQAYCSDAHRELGPRRVDRQ